MKWSEMSDKDKVKLVLEHIFGCYFVDDDSFTERHRGNMPKDFHWPIAWWDSLIERWQTRDISSNWNTQFDPLHDMNDAWQIVERFEYSTFIHKAVTDRSRRLCEAWIYTGYDVWKDGKRVPLKKYFGVANTMPEAICLAALEASGVEFES